MIIDVHAHCIPQGFKDWLAESGGPLGAEVVETGRGPAVRLADKVTTNALREDLTDTELRVAALDRMGVDRQILSGWIDLTAYELEPSAGAAYSRVHNECLAEEAAKAPDRFAAIGTIPLQDPTLAVGELDHAVRELGMVGVEIATTVDGVFLDEAGLDDFWAAAKDLGAFVVLHPMRPLEGVDLKRYFMENPVARPIESTIALAGLIFSGVFERHSGIKMCIVHGGGFAPYQAGRFDSAYAEKPELAGAHISKPPSEYLKELYVDTVLHNPLALRYAVEFMGADHVMLGTDYPFEMGESDPVGFIESADLGEETTSAVLGTTAEKLIFG